jgi:hypothetical protein
MNPLIKNMEAVFVIALGLACSASLVLSPVEQAVKPTPVSVSVGHDGQMAVVVVKAKRMTEQEKQQSLREERAMSAMGEQSRNRT